MKNWRYCPQCGSPGVIRGEANNPFFSCPNCDFVKYNNPLPTTIGLVEQGGRVLLLRRALEPMRGRWDAVGGFLASFETAEECLRRESFEELHIEVENPTLIGTYASVYGSTNLATVGVAFLCSLPGDAKIQLSDENSEFAWFEYDNLPEVAFADVRAALLDRAHKIQSG